MFFCLPKQLCAFLCHGSTSLQRKVLWVYFGKIFNDEGFLNNFPFLQEISQPECPSPQEFQLVKVLLKHVSTEKCRRLLGTSNQKAEEISHLRKSNSVWLFSCQPFQTCLYQMPRSQLAQKKTHKGEPGLLAERPPLPRGPGHMGLCSIEHSPMLTWKLPISFK